MGFPNLNNNDNYLEKVAGIIDIVLYLVDIMTEYLNRLCTNLKSLPRSFTILDIANLIEDVTYSVKESSELIIKLMPSKEKNNEKYKEFWLLHSTLIFYHYDSLILLKHSLISAFTGYYSVAYIGLRNAVESVVRGVIYDLISIPSFRERSEDLQKIEGFKQGKGFKELLNLLEKRLGNKRLNISIEIFDIIDKELKDFNPEASFIKLLKQLKRWNIIDRKLFEEIDTYYTDLSKYIHRVHPKFSEVGLRLLTDKDWMDLEPIPEELYKYLEYFVYFNSLIVYLILKVFSIDIIENNYRNYLDWSQIDEDICIISKLSNKYLIWKRIKEILMKLKS